MFQSFLYWEMHLWPVRDMIIYHLSHHYNLIWNLLDKWAHYGIISRERIWIDQIKDSTCCTAFVEKYLGNGIIMASIEKILKIEDIWLISVIQQVWQPAIVLCLLFFFKWATANPKEDDISNEGQRHGSHLLWVFETAAKHEPMGVHSIYC